MMEICKEISELRMEWRDTNGRMVVDTPEGLFTKFLALAGSLPDCARGWPIQLCSTYYSALPLSITNRMISSKEYTSPSLVGLDNKQSQLEALQIVRAGATRSHRELADEDERMEKKLKVMMRATGRNGQNYFAGGESEDIRHEYGFQDNRQGCGGNVNQYQGTPNENGHKEGDRGGAMYEFRRQPSLAEGVIQSYTQHEGVETRKNSVTGENHPYDPEYNFTSRFPLEFSGCFICGSTDHFSRLDCPVGIRNKEERRLFFNEIWAHKPHTKMKNREGNGSVSFVVNIFIICMIYHVLLYFVDFIYSSHHFNH